jgi:hypothetical protein
VGVAVDDVERAVGADRQTGGVLGSRLQKVVITPLGSTLRMRWFSVSAM